MHHLDERRRKVGPYVRKQTPFAGAVFQRQSYQGRGLDRILPCHEVEEQHAETVEIDAGDACPPAKSSGAR